MEKICFIVNNKNHLVGTISDGDIRRYLLLKELIKKRKQKIYVIKFLFSNNRTQSKIEIKY